MAISPAAQYWLKGIPDINMLSTNSYHGIVGTAQAHSMGTHSKVVAICACIPSRDSQRLVTLHTMYQRIPLQTGAQVHHQFLVGQHCWRSALGL